MTQDVRYDVDDVEFEPLCANFSERSAFLIFNAYLCHIIGDFAFF